MALTSMAEERCRIQRAKQMLVRESVMDDGTEKPDFEVEKI